MAPLVGIHLPNRSGMIAPAVASAMNTVPNRYMPPSDRLPRNCWYTAIATTATEPPSHIGVPAQYRSEVSAPAYRPNARRTQT